jgi:hypothetical protein
LKKSTSFSEAYEPFYQSYCSILLTFLEYFQKKYKIDSDNLDLSSFASWIENSMKKNEKLKLWGEFLLDFGALVILLHETIRIGTRNVFEDRNAFLLMLLPYFSYRRKTKYQEILFNQHRTHQMQELDLSNLLEFQQTNN